ncbi:MAG: T9SS type A sorting domain-containing protein [Sphingobacteriales bacterium]|nr:T9SS type A sorting domain-containing protein [Sphingobacteriales bacterium]
MKATLPILLIIFCQSLAGQSSSGPNDAGTFSNNASVGTVAWTNQGNAITSNDNYALATVSLGLLGSANTNYLVATNYGFAIPGTAIITGIKVEIEKHYFITLGLLSSVTDNSVRLLKGGTIGGNNNALGAWPSSDAYSTYGGSADLWGRTWSAADINNSGFGVAISTHIAAGLAGLDMDALVDHIRITVYFNIPVPVKFVDMEGIQLKEKIKLHWSTATENGSRHFIAEKMLPGQNEWKAIDTIPAAGESNMIRHYTAFDESPGLNNLYRICQVDQDGKYTYSNTIRVAFDPAAYPLVKVYPNPAGEQVMISAAYPVTLLELTDFGGRLVRQIRLPGTNSQAVLMLDRLPNGIYNLLIGTKSHQYIQKLILEK